MREFKIRWKNLNKKINKYIYYFPFNESQWGLTWFWTPIDFHCVEILQNIFFCVPQRKASHWCVCVTHSAWNHVWCWGAVYDHFSKRLELLRSWVSITGAFLTPQTLLVIGHAGGVHDDSIPVPASCIIKGASNWRNQALGQFTTVRGSLYSPERCRRQKNCAFFND